MIFVTFGIGVGLYFQKTTSLRSMHLLVLWFGQGSPRGPCVQGYIFRVVMLGGGRTFRRWGLVGVPSSLKASPTSSSSSLIPGSWGQCFVPPCAPATVYCPCQRPKAIGASGSWILELQQPWTKINLFSLFKNHFYTFFLRSFEFNASLVWKEYPSLYVNCFRYFIVVTESWLIQLV